MVVGAALDVAIGGMTKALEATTQTLKDGFDLANKSQKASLALGLSLGQTRDKLSHSMDGLRGSLDQKMAGQLQTLEAGFQKNTAGVSKLINQQILTGTAHAKTAKSMASLHAVMGLSMEATNTLATDTIELGRTYGVSTDSLVGAMEAFQEQFADLNLLGMGEGMTNAVVQLKAKMGPEFHGSIDKILKMFLQTGTKGMNTMAALGLAGFRDEAKRYGKDSAASLALLERAIKKADGNFKDMAGGAGASMLSLGVITDKFGKDLSHLNVLTKKMEEGFRDTNDTNNDYADQISVFLDEVWNPFKDAIMSVYVGVLPLLEIGLEKVAEWTQLLVDRLSMWFIEIGGLEGITNKLKQAWEDFKIGLEKAWEGLKTVMVIIGKALLAGLAMFLGLVLLYVTLAFGPLILSAAATTFNFIALNIALLPLTLTILAVMAAIGLLVAIVGAIIAKFVIFDPLVAGISWAFNKVRTAIGDLLIAFGEIFGVPDILIEWGNKIKGIDVDVTKPKEETPDEKQAKTTEEIRLMLANQFEMDRAFMGVQEEKTDQIEVNTRKAVDRTGPEFLDETAILLNETMSDILGISARDETTGLFEDMRDYLEEIAIKEPPSPKTHRGRG